MYLVNKKENALTNKSNASLNFEFVVGLANIDYPALKFTGKFTKILITSAMPTISMIIFEKRIRKSRAP